MDLGVGLNMLIFEHYWANQGMGLEELGNFFSTDE
jgi:hypothetical protein